MTILDWIRLGFDAAILLFIAYVAYRFYLEWREHSDLPTWKRILRCSYDSATIVWTKVVSVVAVIVAFIESIGDFFGIPEIRTFFESWIGNPKALSAILLAVSALFYFARLRSLRPAIAQGLISG